jgi:hypothetical protein
MQKENITIEKVEVINGAVLSIMTLSFDEKGKWRFIYDGNRLPSMDMKDAGLQQEIDNGKAFAKGDAIRVDLEITKEFNHIYNAWENKKYRIIDFIEHIPRPKQMNMFD